MKGIGDIILCVELDICHHTRLRFVSFAVLCRKKKISTVVDYFLKRFPLF